MSEGETPVVEPDAFRYEWKDGKLVFPLSKPITAHGETLHSVVLREPTGKDWVGHPYIFDFFGEHPVIRHDGPKVIHFIANNLQIPSSSVEQMKPKEISQVVLILSPFFSPM